MNAAVLQNNFRSGMVAIVGRPNVGKSTLLNRILNKKITIVSPVPQTTRNQVRGIYNDQRGQIVFIDTPGLHFGRDNLDRFMNQSAYGVASDADCLVYLTDATVPVGKEEQSIAERLGGLKVPVILGLNKVDKGDRFIPAYIELWEKVKGKPLTGLKDCVLLPLSATGDIHIDKLIDILLDHLPPGPPLYPSDMHSDTPQKMAMADIVREKLFHTLRQEIPHALAVIIEDIQPGKKKLLHVRALILVEHLSQKKIVIGRDGAVLKKVGMEARHELEALLGHKIFLEIFVKTKRNWRDDYSVLEEMGYVYE